MPELAIVLSVLVLVVISAIGGYTLCAWMHPLPILDDGSPFEMHTVVVLDDENAPAVYAPGDATVIGVVNNQAEIIHAHVQPLRELPPDLQVLLAQQL